MYILTVVLILLGPITAYAQSHDSSVEIRFSLQQRFERFERTTVSMETESVAPISTAAALEVKAGRWSFEGEREAPNLFAHPQPVLSGQTTGLGHSTYFEGELKETAVTLGYELVSGLAVEGGYDFSSLHSFVPAPALKRGKLCVSYQGFRAGVGAHYEHKRGFVAARTGFYPRIYRTEKVQNEFYENQGSGWMLEFHGGLKLAGPLGLAVSYSFRQIQTEDGYWTQRIRAPIVESLSLKGLGFGITLGF